MSLLGTSVKVVKGEKRGVLTAVMYLSPSTESGANLCPHATPGCAAACLGHSSGRLAMPSGLKSRLRKSRLFLEDRKAFLTELERDIAAHQRRAIKLGMVCAVRLNGSSDIPWERVAPHLFSAFPNVEYYDYTKDKARAIAWAEGRLPENYHLTFSRAETPENQMDAGEVLAAGGNVAVVFSAPPYPSHYLERPVIDGDEDDVRFMDPKGVVVGLKAKGAGKKDRTGFVVQLSTDQIKSVRLGTVRTAS